MKEKGFNINYFSRKLQHRQNHKMSKLEITTMDSLSLHYSKGCDFPAMGFDRHGLEKLSTR